MFSAILNCYSSITFDHTHFVQGVVVWNKKQMRIGLAQVKSTQMTMSH